MKKGYFAVVMMMLSIFTLAIGLTEAQAAPDLKVIDLIVQDYTAGRSHIFITDVTKNRGADAAGASITRYYLSQDATIDPGDSILGMRVVPALDPGESNTGTNYVLIPNKPAGTYYIIAKADALQYVTESKEGNNKRVKSILLYSRTANPDLIIFSLTAPSSASPGQNINISDTTKNDDLGGTLQTVTVFYLSADSTLGSGDVLLGNRLVPILSAGASSSGTTNVTIPPETTAGSYYIIAVADGSNIVFETDETNNKMSRAITIGP